MRKMLVTAVASLCMACSGTTPAQTTTLSCEVIRDVCAVASGACGVVAPPTTGGETTLQPTPQP